MAPNKRFRRNVMFQVALSSTLFLFSAGHWCEKLSHDKLSSLREKIDSFFGFAVLCPFTIEGSGCDDDNLGYDVSTHNVHLQCQEMNSQTGERLDEIFTKKNITSAAQETKQFNE